MNRETCRPEIFILLLLLLLSSSSSLLTPIELSLGSSSSYNSTDKTNNTNIHTQYKKHSTDKTKQNTIYTYTYYIKVHVLSNRDEATQLEADRTPHPINMIKNLWNISHPHIKPLCELVLAPCIHLTSTILTLHRFMNETQRLLERGNRLWGRLVLT
jgi:hypothetical protein